MSLDKKIKDNEYSQKHYLKNKKHYKKVRKIYYLKNRELINGKTKEYYKQNKTSSLFRVRKYTKKLREIILNHYGWKCSCPNCPEKNPIFLTIDHKNNDGYKDKMKSGHRYGGSNLYRKIIKENFPDTYQVLCWNCNCGKRSNGGICPHNNIKI